MNRLRAAGLCAALAGMTFPVAHAALAPWSSLQGKTVLFVTGGADSPTPNDDASVARHLQSLGFVVHTVDATAPASDADGAALVVLSSTANPHVLGDKYADTPVPLFTWNTYDYPNLGLPVPVRTKDSELSNPGSTMPASLGLLSG